MAGFQCIVSAPDLTTLASNFPPHPPRKKPSGRNETSNAWCHRNCWGNTQSLSFSTHFTTASSGVRLDIYVV